MQAAAGGEFVDGWLVAQVLGEGAYGEVRLLVHAASGASVALKAVSAAAGAAREAALHRALRHPHVLRCLGERAHLGRHYVFLEYAQGGELFDRIEPDRGMPAPAARRYWRQLAAGLLYLHERGVAHRDIKPENLLLDHRDRLKISDFGMATVFRHGARERLLSRVCGTLPYAAPEVLRAVERPYRAEPADVWAAALVLRAMLLGELPWESAADNDARYSEWSSGGHAGGAWRRLDAPALALLRRALAPRPDRRAPLAELRLNPWLCADTDTGGGGGESAPTGGARGWCSQPAGGAGATAGPDLGEALSYSQPAHPDDLLLSEPGDAAGGAARMVRRLTRLWLRVEPAHALLALQEALDSRGYVWRRLQPHILAIECSGEVRMRAWALGCGGSDGSGGAGGARALVEVRRSRGCGLEFKRRFVELRAALAGLQAPAPPHADLLAPLRLSPV